MSQNTFLKKMNKQYYKVGMMDVTSSTNTRTVISSIISNFPCGHKVPILTSKTYKINGPIIITEILNSFVFDYLVRLRLGGQSLIWSILGATPFINTSIIKNKNVIQKGFQLLFCHNSFAYCWFFYKMFDEKYKEKHWKKHWAITQHERLRLRCIIDAIIAEFYKLDINDFTWILRNDSTDSKGFWRVDKDKPQELRHTTLSLIAFRDLKKMIEKNGGDRNKGIREFCEQHNGEGWMIPETISFVQKDNGVLEFDTPDSETYEVRSKLGERFLPWQLEGTPEESWKECETHARNILGDEEFEKFMKDLDEGNDLTVTDVISKATSKMNKEKDEKGKQQKLFE